MREEGYVVLRGPSSSEGASDPQGLTPLDVLNKAIAEVETACDRYAVDPASQKAAAKVFIPLAVAKTLAAGASEAEERYAALGRACEGNGLGWYAEDGTMRFQAPEDVIAECAVTAYISRQCGDA